MRVIIAAFLKRRCNMDSVQNLEPNLRRLGHISKQGNALMRWLLVEAGQVAARHDEQWRRQYLRLSLRHTRAIAKVAMARKLAVRLYWMFWAFSGPKSLGCPSSSGSAFRT